jgi:F1F0 ATPase subunit 2
VGGTFGALYFLGLSWTVRHGVSAANPALWFAASAVARMTLLLAGFYYFASGSLTAVLTCLAGFIIARAAVTRFAHPVPRSDSPCT